MQRVTGWVALGALSIMAFPAAPALADSAAGYAKSACKDRLRRDYNAGASHVTASDRGGDRFTVTGSATRAGESAQFTCRYDRGNVQGISLGSWHKSNDDGAGTAAAVVGIAALAAVIAAASSKKRSHEYDNYGRENYDRYDNNSYYEDSYSPASGVTCYRNQRACFNSYNNNYNPRWTQREFGY